jgi:hypothetical protein
MINQLEILVIDEITFSNKDICDIMVNAIHSILNEEKYNFSLEHHNKYKRHEAINKGCGCTYCKLRYKLRNIELYKAKKIRELNYDFDNLGQIDIENYQKSIENLKSQIKEIKEEKKLVKIELNITKNDN